jgi:protease IV
MKTFFTSFFGSCLGVVVSFLLLGLIIIGFGVSGSSNEKALLSNSVLKINLDGVVPEKTDNVPSGGSSELFSPPSDAIGLYRITQLIEYAASDSKIKGISIENVDVSLGQASITMLLRSLEKFKESKKFIYAYGDFYSQSAYYVSSVADSIFLNPQGGVDLKGYGSTIPFFKNMLDKVGVDMEVFYAGNFKSATEPFRLTEMSEYNKIQTRAFLTDMKDIMVASVSKHRKISTADVENVMQTYGARSAKKALSAKIVDATIYKSEYEGILRKKLGIAAEKKIKSVSIADYNKTYKPEEVTTTDKIAIVFAEGEVIYGSESHGVISEKSFLKFLEKIKNDDKVKAVVLRVNSPGGNAFTSDVIWHQIEEIKKSGKKVVASFGDYAASGGYYIAVGADKIFAEPNTLTGSIGVFMMMPNATKLLNEKIGVNFDTIKTHPFAGGFSPMVNMTAAEKVIMQESTMDIYDLFIDRVSKGRKLSVDSTKVIAQGRVWTGRKAVEIGLVDQIGGLDVAITEAAKLAGIKSYKTVEYPVIEDDFFRTMIKEVQREANKNDASTVLFTNEERKMYQYLKDWRGIIRCKEPQARLPLIFDF